MHEVTHEDSRGDIVDVSCYCCDTCARTDDDYTGWNGCNESGQDQWCEACGARCDVEGDSPCWDTAWRCLPVVVNVLPGHDPEPCEHGVPRYMSLRIESAGLIRDGEITFTR